MTIENLEKYNPSHFYDVKSQLKDYVYNNTSKLLENGKSRRNLILTKDELRQRQCYVRSKFLDSIGGMPSCETPLDPVVTGVVQSDDFHIEKVIYQSRPNCFVTANLYMPDGLKNPSGAVLFLCGHDPLAKHSYEYQMVCQCLTKRGIIVLAIDPVGQGERVSYYEEGSEIISRGTAEHTHAGLQCLMTGYPSARYFLQDAIRGIDYLLTRPEVDSDNIGVTGNSGGGTQTCMVMLCDDRVKAFAPGTYITSYEENILSGVPQDSEQNWPGFLKYGFEHEDILLSAAPKPVAVLAASYDFFPIEGTRKTVENAKKYWKLWGKEDNLYYYEDVTQHSYSFDLALKAAEFFTRSLEIENREDITLEDIHIINPKKLWCTKKGQIKEEKRNSRFIYEENLSLLNRMKKDVCTKENAYQWLKEQVYHQRNICALNLRKISRLEYNDLSIASYIWRSQERMMNHCLVFEENSNSDVTRSPTIAVWDGGTRKLKDHMEWIQNECEKGRKVLVLNTSGVGGIAPYQTGAQKVDDKFGTIYKLADDLIRSGDSLCALRIFDVIRSVDMLQDLDAAKCRDIRIHVCGWQGIYGILAAFLDERIESVSIEEPVLTYNSWVAERYYENEPVSIILPKALRFFDIDNVVGWMKEENRIEICKGDRS